VRLDIDTATSLGIIVNELLANSYEHAFTGPAGSIEVSLQHKEGEAHAVLTIGDDGSGLAEAATDSVGLALVRRLVTRIKGSLEVRAERGTKWSITLPVPVESGVGERPTFGRARGRAPRQTRPVRGA
jgi:two-component sensor histidine kinase